VLAHRIQPDAWAIAPIDVAADGALDGLDNYDRVRVFEPGGATKVVDAAYPGAKLAGWTRATPSPLVVLARRSGQSVWVAGVVGLLDDGTLTGITNVDRVVVWRIDQAPAPFHDGDLATAIVPGWDPSAPSALVLGVEAQVDTPWFVGLGVVRPDGHLDEIVATRIVGWKLER
jgi:hypothetical protein